MNRPDESPKNSIIIYTTEDGLTKIDATFDGDTVWLSIDQMAELFKSDRISYWMSGRIESEYLYYFKQRRPSAAMVTPAAMDTSTGLSVRCASVGASWASTPAMRLGLTPRKI